MRDTSAVRGWFDRAEASFGPLDILLANMGPLPSLHSISYHARASQGPNNHLPVHPMTALQAIPKENWSRLWRDYDGMVVRDILTSKDRNALRK